MLRDLYQTIALVFTLVLSAPAVAQVSAPNPMPAATVTERRLPNGARVVVRRDASAPLTAVDLWVRAGSVDDGGTGAAHALEHMVFEGTEGAPAGKVDAAVEAAGGSVFAATLPDATHYWTTVPPSGTDAAITALTDLVRPALVDPASWERERRVMLEEIERSRGDNPLTVRRSLMSSLYSGAWGAPVAGTPEVLRTLTPEAIKGFQKRCYVPERMVLVVVGAVDPDTILAQAEKTLGRLSRGDSAPQSLPPAARQGPVRAYAYSGDSVTVGIAWPASGGRDLAPDVLASVLKPRLQQALSGLAGRVEVAHPWQRAGMLALLATGPKERRAGIEKALEEGMTAVASVTAREVAAAVRDRQWTWWLDNEKPVDQARVLGLAAVLGEVSDATGTPGQLGSVDVQEVRSAARSILGTAAAGEASSMAENPESPAPDANRP